MSRGALACTSSVGQSLGVGRVSAQVIRTHGDTDLEDLWCLLVQKDQLDMIFIDC